MRCCESLSNAPATILVSKYAENIALHFNSSINEYIKLTCQLEVIDGAKMHIFPPQSNVLQLIGSKFNTIAYIICPNKPTKFQVRRFMRLDFGFGGTLYSKMDLNYIGSAPEINHTGSKNARKGLKFWKPVVNRCPPLMIQSVFPHVSAFG